MGSDRICLVYIQSFCPYLDIGHAVSAANFYKVPLFIGLNRSRNRSIDGIG